MDPSSLSSSLRVVISALHKGLRKQMYSVDAYSMTEIDTIRHLLRNEMLLPSELAALTRVKTQSMSQILKKLEDQGVIVRTPSQSDKRKVYISITPFGREMVNQTKYDREEWLKGVITQSLTEEERALLEKALPVLHKLVEYKG
ncbi:MarR family winged helix-turn-helix transcriptional regulator [Microbacter margulisiae]|uniref:DNA-binding MarR family transcriptional regulator n=1 Tax=Microbacter margulisiae TaxID=1350067 RepID=A0A7W5DRQ1_9PORP|nr:MarR family transcriptional regulator [Microbacter margulisiae]MBB3187523.1 DNA-binding MarR family transcriptional regulator [Microbacter margulisiae]